MNLVGIVGRAGSGKDTVAGFLRDLGWASLAFADPLKAFVRDAWNLPDAVLWGPSELRELPILRCGCGWVGVEGMPGITDEYCCATWARERLVLSTCSSCGSQVPPEDIAVGDPEAPTLCACGAQEPCHLVPLTPRLALQRLGTEWGRALDPDVWVRRGVRRALIVLGRSTGSGVESSDPTFPEDSRDREGAYWPKFDALVQTGSWFDTRRVAGVVLTDCRFPNEAAAIRAAGGAIWRVVRPPSDVAAALGEGDPIAEQWWRGHASETEQDGIKADRTICNDGTLDDLRQAVLAAARGGTA